MTETSPSINMQEISSSRILARRAFNDHSLQAEFDLNGYVTIPNFLDKEAIAEMESLYLKFSSAINVGFHVTNWVKDTTYSIESHLGIKSLLAGKLTSILNKYKPVLGCFAVKEAGFENSMGLHQDWSLTDESEFYGISVWIPLVDVGENSGALRILKGSHRLFSNIRGQKINNQLDKISPRIIEKYLTSIPMKAGDLLILHHRVVHSSGSAKQRRIATMLAAIPQEANVKHYMADTNDPAQRKLRVFDCPDDFYVGFDIESNPPGIFETAGIEQSNVIVTDLAIEHYYSK